MMILTPFCFVLVGLKKTLAFAMGLFGAHLDSAHVLSFALWLVPLVSTAVDCCFLTLSAAGAFMFVQDDLCDYPRATLRRRIIDPLPIRTRLFA